MQHTTQEEKPIIFIRKNGCIVCVHNCSYLCTDLRLGNLGASLLELLFFPHLFILKVIVFFFFWKKNLLLINSRL